MIEIHSDGWDDVAADLIRRAEEDVAQAMAQDALNNGAESSDSVDIDLTGMPENCDASRVEERIRQILREKLGR